VGVLAIATAIAVAALLGLAALAGQWSARRGAAHSSRGETAARMHALGPLRVTVPSEWRQLPVHAAGLRGTEPKSTLVFDTAPGLSARAVLMLESLASVIPPSLLPTPLLDAAGSSPGRPRAVRLDGRRSWMYTAVPARRTADTMDITVLPTTAGVMSVACAAPRLAFAGAVSCASDLRIVLDGARALRPTIDLAFRLRLPEVAPRLDSERVTQRMALSRARTPAAQARAARRLAAAHARAAGSLAPLARGGAATELVALLRESSREYDALARSVAARDRGAYERASRAIDDADDRLAHRIGSAAR
jgi:hypothetical protein